MDAPGRMRTRFAAGDLQKQDFEDQRIFRIEQAGGTCVDVCIDTRFAALRSH